MSLKTRLTERFGIEHPILLAPMGMIAGGRLAAAVSNAGGLGLIGGGYGDEDWLNREFAAAGNARVGCGFITWSMAKQPHLLDLVLARQPAAVMLSFGSPAPFAPRIREAGIPLICQVQSIAHAREALDVGADVIVAQGGEAGGHSGNRSTFTLLPEVADLVANQAPETLVVAAGGVADGRALAAALMLGADGVLVGTRFMATDASAAPNGFREAMVAADGDQTIKTRSVDVVRNLHWPNGEFAPRALNNRFVADWHGREEELAEESTLPVQNKLYWDAFHKGDIENTGVLMGEAVGVIKSVETPAKVIDGMVGEAVRLLARGSDLIAHRLTQG
ncbi:MAG: nitronate monooxygenase [Methylocystis sp.]|nr:nitronate monooxygenase [Methylocystis sp.]MCA3584116.1 nitronate monooxygenase [Methylocystis sp.]MCA3588341.1 nitronate monooxygenase [Methylocystis sp.]MCA3591236.1 nitronate monooxygenase [Methylocystis sp.]